MFKLIKGFTKSSFALNIAKKAGLPDSIIKRADLLLKVFSAINTENSDDDDEEHSLDRRKRLIEQCENLFSHELQEEHNLYKFFFLIFNFF